MKIQATKAGVNGKVDKLTLSNIQSKGGPCLFDRIKAGIIDIVYNETGLGDGFATKDFKIESSVVCKICVNVDNVETPISPP